MEESKPKAQNQTFSTPMMKQYQEIKGQHSDCLLFFRLGDFYELFNDDAKIGAEILNITLTKRPRGKDGDIPMAGVPFHAADTYIAKLVKAGHKVAICEQITEPNSRGIVEREVIRIITPGTILDEKTLEKKEHNYIMSLSIDGSRAGIAVADLSTGDFQTTELALKDDLQHVLGNELARFNPSECIVNETLYQDGSLIKILRMQSSMNISCFPRWNEQAEDADKKLLGHFKLTSLRSFGLDQYFQAQRASASLLGYLRHTQKDQIDHIQTIRTYHPSDYVILDRSTIANLELFSTIREHDHRGSFIRMLDYTSTAMGGRMLREWIRKPLSRKQSIEQRLDAVEFFYRERLVREALKTILRHMADIPRLLGRLSVGIGNAYDLVNLKKSLLHALEVKSLIQNQPEDIIAAIDDSIPASLSSLISHLEHTIVENPPIDTKGGGLIRPGIHSQLDELREIVSGGKEWIARLESHEKNRTKISSLRIKYNRVFGYYIEISKANLHLVPEDYMRKQTMVNAERFITPKLKEYEEKIVTAEETINKLEYELFLETVHQVLSYGPTLQKAAESLAMLDCLINFADIAEWHNYVRPQLTEDGNIEINEGRHPVVEQLVSDPFVPNDTRLDSGDHQLIIITGPNMAGKSVYMRQVALIVLMAHIGCFVPAKAASISLVDRIFVRSGASDFIASGLSTFMVEMVETAHILHHATEKSLVIMDEIGRGTSTYDGISIAWAVAEFLVSDSKARAKTLFATHYHELQMLEDQFPEHIKNYNVMVEQKDDGDPIFLHKVMPGRASHSYAIAVAKLAGVPKEVTRKASELLKKMEGKSISGNGSFNNAVRNQSVSAEVLQKLTGLDLNKVTPIDALNILSDLNAVAKNSLDNKRKEKVTDK